MGKIYQGIEELVGHTPLVNFRRLAKAEGVNAEILAKLGGIRQHLSGVNGEKRHDVVFRLGQVDLIFIHKEIGRAHV